MIISVVGTDFRTANVAVREQAALTHPQLEQLLRVAASEHILHETVILSTCNRTEFYFASDGGGRDGLAHLLTHHARIKGLAAPIDASIFRRHDGLDAVRHLFRVASSLESQIVGEREIQGQVKEAYRLACEAGTAKFLFHKLMHWSFRAAKRVMTDTGLGQGTASVAQAAVDLSRQVFSSLAGKTVLLVGAGQAAELLCQALVRAGATNLMIANRTPANAHQLAEGFLQWRMRESLRSAGDSDQDDGPVRCPALTKMMDECPMRRPSGGDSAPQLRATAIALDEIPSVIKDADLVICSSGAAEAVLRADGLRPVLRGMGHSMLMIDISVPRNIDPALGDVPGVYLCNIDGLDALVARNIERRSLEIPRAHAIIDDEVERFDQWLASLGVVPTIKLLTRHIADLQQAELDRYLKKFPSSERDKLREFARTLCAKIVHDPISFLRQLDGDGKADEDLSTISTLRRIFNLDETLDEDKR